MIENYLTILEDSLRQKVNVLDEISECNTAQEQLLKQESLSLEEFDEYVDKKDVLIQKLNKLDEGFDSLYEKIREQLLKDKEAYKAQISRIQQLISQVTEKSVSIQAQEARNRKAVEYYFANEKQQLRQSRQSSKAAYDYYRSMNNANVVPPQFMDKKK